MADNETPQPPAGWYPDPTQPGQQRYWDGTQWTEHTAPGGEAGTSEPAATGSGDAGWGSTGWDSGGGAGDTGGFAASGGYGSGATAGYQGEKPDPWLWQSILATLFCCQILGIVGIVFAAQSQSAIGSGDYATAREKAQKAKTWTLIAVGAGVVVIIGVVALGALGFISESSTQF